MKNDIDSKTVMEVARVLHPKMKKAVNDFETETYRGICQYLVERGMFPRLHRLRGNISTYDLHRVQRMVSILRMEYENQVMRGLISFVLHHGPIVLPEVEMQGFYESIYKMLNKNDNEN